MIKKFVVKDFNHQTYYCGEGIVGPIWDEAYLAELFDSVEEAELFISRENGKFQIETIYII